MRLLDTETGQFVDFPDVTRLPPYAILSHTWNSEGEQTYQDLKDIQHAHARNVQLPVQPPPEVPTIPTAKRRLGLLHSSSGAARPVSDHIAGPATTGNPCTMSFWDGPTISPKVRMACVVARVDGYRYIWIDSCCIDKTSSAELSEAINSMYRWYGKAAICYAFLADVPRDDLPHATTSIFRQSRWFTRGWTLQELIAPRNLLFMSKEWSIIGSKQDLSALLEEVTGIDVEVLKQQKRLDEVSVARRMSWASKRRTTRVEDEAYSLFGIFDVNMPTLYGEGSRAFMRLQQEILQQIPDQSLFAWGGTHSHSLPLGSDPVPDNHDHTHLRPHFYSLLQSSSLSLFASSPSSFLNSGSIHTISDDNLLHRLRGLDVPVLEYTPSPYGLRTQFLLLDVGCSSPSADEQSSIVLSKVHGGTQVRRWYLAILACEHAHRRGELLSRICFTESSNANLELLRSGFVYSGVVGGLQRRLKWWDKPISDFDVLVSLSPSQIEDCRPNLALKTVYVPYSKGDMSSDPSLEYATLPGGRSFGWTLELSETDRSILKNGGYHVYQWTPDEPNRHCLTLTKQSHEVVALNLEYRRAGGEELDLRVEVGVGHQRRVVLGWERWRSAEALFAFQKLKLNIFKSNTPVPQHDQFLDSFHSLQHSSGGSPDNEEDWEDLDEVEIDVKDEKDEEAAIQEVLVHLQIRLERSVEADRHRLRLDVEDPETWGRRDEWSPGSPDSKDSDAPSLSRLIDWVDKDTFRVGAYRQPEVCAATEDEFRDAIAVEHNGPRCWMQPRQPQHVMVRRGRARRRGASAIAIYKVG